MALIVYVSQKVKGNVTLLIIGVMIGYVASAIIGVLKYFSVEEDIRAYVIWGLGSFARVSGDQMILFVCIMVVLLPLSFLLIKTMNLLLLGDGYARNLGLNIKRARLLVISCSGVLAVSYTQLTQASFTRLIPPKRIAALTTPISAPPAMKPDASNVPFSPRSVLRVASLLRLVTYQLMAPPTTRGMFSCNGMNIPSANANAGILNAFSTIRCV